MLLYYITDRSQFAGSEVARHRQLIDKMNEAAGCGIDFIQLREKDLTTRELETLAREAIHQLGTEHQDRRTRLLINSRTDIALAVNAHGVHLRSHDISPMAVRSIWRSAGAPARATIALSCHSDRDVAAAAEQAADFCVFAPVFEKKGATPAGLDALRRACQHEIPVLALGGVTLENARSCLDAGAAGIAAIRLFQENDLSDLVPRLRSLARR